MAPSKTFNIAGEKLAIATIPNTKMREAFQKELNRLHISEAGALSLAMGEAAYKEGASWLTEVKAYLNTNISIIDDYLKAHHPEVRFMLPDASFIGWIDFNGCGHSHKELMERFYSKGGIAMNEGRWFGPEGYGFFRFNYGCPRSQVEEGLKRISTALA